MSLPFVMHSVDGIKKGYATKNLNTLTYWVDGVNGDDSNDGSEASPFKTINRALKEIPDVHDNVIIKIKKGEYAENIDFKNQSGNVFLVGEFEEVYSDTANGISISSYAKDGSNTTGKWTEIELNDPNGDIVWDDELLKYYVEIQRYHMEGLNKVIDYKIRGKILDYDAGSKRLYCGFNWYAPPDANVDLEYIKIVKIATVLKGDGDSSKNPYKFSSENYSYVGLHGLYFNLDYQPYLDCLSILNGKVAIGDVMSDVPSVDNGTWKRALFTPYHGDIIYLKSSKVGYEFTELDDRVDYPTWSISNTSAGSDADPQNNSVYNGSLNTMGMLYYVSLYWLRNKKTSHHIYSKDGSTIFQIYLNKGRLAIYTSQLIALDKASIGYLQAALVQYSSEIKFNRGLSFIGAPDDNNGRIFLSNAKLICGGDVDLSDDDTIAWTSPNNKPLITLRNAQMIVGKKLDIGKTTSGVKCQAPVIAMSEKAYLEVTGAINIFHQPSAGCTYPSLDVSEKSYILAKGGINIGDSNTDSTVDAEAVNVRGESLIDCADTNFSIYHNPATANTNSPSMILYAGGKIMGGNTLRLYAGTNVLGDNAIIEVFGHGSCIEYAYISINKAGTAGNADTIYIAKGGFINALEELAIDSTQKGYAIHLNEGSISVELPTSINVENIGYILYAVRNSKAIFRASFECSNLKTGTDIIHIVVSAGSYLEFDGFISIPDGDYGTKGIIVVASSRLEMTSAINNTATNINNTNNNGYGMVIKRGSKVRVVDFATQKITGAGGDMDLGWQGATAYPANDASVTDAPGAAPANGDGSTLTNTAGGGLIVV